MSFKFDLNELASPEVASAQDEASTEIATARMAIMHDPDLIDIVLGSADGKRVLRCRLDEKNRAIYPAFR